MSDDYIYVSDSDEEAQGAPVGAQEEGNYLTVGVCEEKNRGKLTGRFISQKNYQYAKLHYGCTSSRLEATVLYDLMSIKLLGAQEAR
jgi:hypothetical protein